MKCPHCGKEQKRAIVRRPDLYWRLEPRLRYLCCGVEVIDCTSEVYEIIERHSPKRVKDDPLSEK